TSSGIRANPALTLTPLEFRAEDGEEILLRKSDEPDARGGFAYLDCVPLSEPDTYLPIDCRHDLLVGQQAHYDTVRTAQHDRAVGQGVRADGSQDDGVHRGEEDRPTRRERVGGRSGRGRDDEAVSAIRGGMAAIDGHREVDDAAHRGFRDDQVVERRVFA